MNSGMLWFDNDPRTELPAKINKAANYYRQKYGSAPTICYVNPRMSQKKNFKQGRIHVETSDAILPNHLWIGLDE